ncbi:MAG: hypothetical protein BWX80_00876 [Candidatus Hydrogenedentes bacterium ADurb.Bin101]|jgi:hypothetical protein|nr:MAG: hypothetical protein BWX80_00876 [Candidatus Hydrogenedentes bacterium ADurb.Bin101]
MPGLAQESKNSASFRFFAVEKGRVAERVPGREKTGIHLLKPCKGIARFFFPLESRRWIFF